MTTAIQPTREHQIAVAITSNRMERVDACEWATPAVREVLAEYAADHRESIPFSVGLDRIRRAIEADRAATKDAAGLRLVS